MEVDMSDALSWGIAAGFAAQEGIKFLYGQMADLLKRSRERKERSDCGSAATTGNSDVLVASPPATAFAQAPGELRLPVASIAGSEGVLEALLGQVGVFLDASKAGQPPDEKSWQAVRDLRALVESISGQRLSFTGEPKEVRPIIRLKAVIKEIDEKAQFTGVEVKSGNQKDANISLDLGRVGGVATGYRET
jgi:hypothetical protein